MFFFFKIDKIILCLVKCIVTVYWIFIVIKVFDIPLQYSDHLLMSAFACLLA
jgi:hypothetical protein